MLKIFNLWLTDKSQQKIFPTKVALIIIKCIRKHNRASYIVTSQLNSAPLCPLKWIIALVIFIERLNSKRVDQYNPEQHELKREEIEILRYQSGGRRVPICSGTHLKVQGCLASSHTNKDSAWTIVCWMKSLYHVCTVSKIWHFIMHFHEPSYSCQFIENGYFQDIRISPWLPYSLDLNPKPNIWVSRV